MLQPSHFVFDVGKKKITPAFFQLLESILAAISDDVILAHINAKHDAIGCHSHTFLRLAHPAARIQRPNSHNHGRLRRFYSIG